MEYEYLTTDEVAQVCRRSPKTVRRWIHDGDLPAWRPGDRHPRRGGGRLLVSRADLDEFLRRVA